MGSMLAAVLLALGLAASQTIAQQRDAPDPAPAGADAPHADASPAATGRDPATLAQPAPILTEEQEERAQALEGRLKCPVCRVQSVRESGSFMALEMRTKIRQLIVEGRTDDEVLEWFVARYGDFILLEPRKRGFGLVAYVLPLAAVLVGATLLALRFRGRSSSSSRAPAPASPDADGPAGTKSPTDDARVERELQRYLT